MKHILAIVFTFLLIVNARAQTAAELFKQRDFQALVKLEAQADKLTAPELYMVGYAFFQLANDSQAIVYYDRAMTKGLDNGTVHFYKGLSLKFLKNLNDAVKEVNIALQKEPNNQEFMNEKGILLYSQGHLNEALTVFQQALKQASTYPEPYYWIAKIHHEREEFGEALSNYYEAVNSLPRDNSNYLNSLLGIGQLEYVVTKNYGSWSNPVDNKLKSCFEAN